MARGADRATEFRRGLIDVVEECSDLTWLLLTHRPHLAEKLAPASWRTSPPVNVWFGVTVDHPAHGRRWRHHAEVWAHTGRAWVSAEPLAASLASIDLTGAAVTIYGGASGTNDPTWEFQPEWVAEAVDRYGEDRVFFKQFGDFRDGKRIGKKAAGRDLAGRVWEYARCNRAALGGSWTNAPPPPYRCGRFRVGEATILWDTAALARYMGYTEATVRTLSSRSPDRLPPRIPNGGHPRWHPATVEAWAQ